MTRRRIEYVVTRDSEDVGLDRGMRLYVVPGSTKPSHSKRSGTVDFDVPVIDARITGVRVPHPDLRLVR